MHISLHHSGWVFLTHESLYFLLIAALGALKTGMWIRIHYKGTDPDSAFPKGLGIRFGFWGRDYKKFKIVKIFIIFNKITILKAKRLLISQKNC
jgi:hypothetical protein